MRSAPAAAGLVLAAFVGLLPVPGFAECHSSSGYSEALAAGDQAAANQQWEQAEACYREAHEHRPRQGIAEPLYRLSMLALAEGDGKSADRKRAEDLLYTAVTTLPRLERPGFYHLELALLYLRNGKPREAEKWLRKVGAAGHWLMIDFFLEDVVRRARWEEAVDRLVRLGEDLARSGRRSEANTVGSVRVLVRALQINSLPGRRHESAWQDAIGGDPPRTASTLKRILDAQPDHPLANFVAGFLLSIPASQQGDIDLTAEQKMRAAESFSRSPPRLELPATTSDDADAAPRLAERLSDFHQRLDSRLARLALGDHALPKVRLLDWRAGEKMVTTLPHMWLAVEATDDRGVAAIEVTVKELTPTGDIAGTWRGTEGLRPAPKHVRLYRLDLPRTWGTTTYRLSLAAVDQANRRSDDQPGGEFVEIDVQYVQKTTNSRKVYLVGVARYKDPVKFPPLSGVVENDVRPLEKYFRRLGHEPKILLDEDVSGDEVENRFRAMAGGAEEAIFYFSGHGGEKGQQGDSCLYMYNGHCKNIEGLAKELRRATTPRMLVIVDACYAGLPHYLDSGDLLGGLQQGREDYERIYVAASAANETAKMRNGASVFTGVFYAVLSNDEFAKEADSDEDGLVTLSEAFEFAKKYIKNEIGGQQPKIYGTRGDNFVFAERPGLEVAKQTIARVRKKVQYAERLKWVEETVAARKGLQVGPSPIIDVLVDKARVRADDLPDEKLVELLETLRHAPAAVTLPLNR